MRSRRAGSERWSRRRCAAVVILGACLVLGGAFAHSHRISRVPSLATHADDPVLPLLASAAEHDEHLHRKRGAYVLRAQDPSGGSLLYIGARHSSDPEDPQVAAISAAWDEFA